MGLLRQMARFVIREVKYRPIDGSVLIIGRQTIHLTPTDFNELLKEEGLNPRPEIPLSLDTTTQKGADQGFITDEYFFRVLGAKTVQAIDVSDYEGADIVHNLDMPIPTELENKFDFICNGSVLDNMFNPVMGLINISRMLAPNGRVIHFEHASNTVNNAYLQFSPNWFFDYSVINNFADCKPYIALFYTPNGPWDFYACLHENGNEPRIFRSARFAMTAVVAEKAADSTWNRWPLQAQYRNAQEQKEYLENLKRFSASDRPFLNRTRQSAFRFNLFRQIVGARRLLKRRGPTAPASPPLLETLASVLPPGLFSKRRGYWSVGKLY